MQRRNKVLDLMETRSTLTGNKHTLAEYEAAKNEPVELVQQVSAAWKAPHFVWQVRRDLATLLCPDSPTDCPKVDTGGYKVITTLDWTMQKTAEKWVYVAARAPNAKNPSAILSSRKIPRAARSWVMGLRGHNINNAAAAVEDYRTGEILAYVGSASYTSKGSKKFQPQFDVLSDGWRQPGSAIKPVDYADRHRRQDADRLDDVHGRHHQLRRRLHPDPGGPPRARPGPAPLGAPVLPEHPGHQGHDHERPGPRLRSDQGLRADLPEDGVAGPVRGHRHAGGPPDRPAGCLRHDRQQRRPHAAPLYRHGPAPIHRSRSSGPSPRSSPRASA